MKNTLHILIFCALAPALQAQISPFHVINDTLIVENFDDDPTATMASIPLGNDLGWVNFDQDGNEALCVNGSTPKAWYYESDLGVDNSTNSAYTSCSFTDTNSDVSTLETNNWLILPPIFIPDSLCKLRWKSLSLLGPAYMDGYKVLVSTTGNDPFEGVYTDTLFRGAEMVRILSPQMPPFELSRYLFSEGYIHANGYSLTDYFTVEDDNYRGKLEPHEVSLSAYQGKNIYIAFLHDSNNDFILQLDDIVVVDEKGVSTRPEPKDLLAFKITPNPVTEVASCIWQFSKPTTAQISISNAQGITLYSAKLEGTAGQLDLKSVIPSLPAGYYMAGLQTEDGIAVRKFVKM